MKKKILLVPVAALAAIVVLAGTAMAQNPYTDLQTMPFVGNGVAVSTSNSAVFRQVNFAIANTNANTNTPANYVGMFGFAGERLNVANINVATDGTVRGDLQRSGATVGSFVLTPVTEQYHFTGTVTLDGNAYSAYVFQKAFVWGWWGFMGRGMMGSNGMMSGITTGSSGGY